MLGKGCANTQHTRRDAAAPENKTKPPISFSCIYIQPEEAEGVGVGAGAGAAALFLCHFCQYKLFFFIPPFALAPSEGGIFSCSVS